MVPYKLIHVLRAEIQEFRLKADAERFLKQQVEKQGDSLLDWACDYWIVIEDANNKISKQYRLPKELMALASGLYHARHLLSVCASEQITENAVKRMNNLTMVVNKL
ncbi:MAG: hypothetical protein HAW67_00170 [Endozoicomonadaceae bacterium]|nr:hypothetical protein [Endozoicomonadaceae bacterium]